ncbi:cytidylate kinase [candidate division TM6 bacterium RIFCSPHIGHO2_12_FULL_36_22]|nr:MAG: cytidylate kinase [candidate division TM6 bacterium RIFCSPHIGHO2_12_FULL_36_22]
MIITIDGPVASGKSSLARGLATILGYHHINSGYFYRALAYILLNYCHKTLNDLWVLDKSDLSCLALDKLEYVYRDGQPRMLYEGNDITFLLKTRDIDDGSSIISTYPFIRNIVNKFQHASADDHNIVIDGRDIGTIVFPTAQLKIYLTASYLKRAERWQQDQKRKGNFFTLEQSLHEVQERDHRDTTRKIAPLTVPAGALIIDNSDLSKEDVIKQVLEQLHKI